MYQGNTHPDNLPLESRVVQSKSKIDSILTQFQKNKDNYLKKIREIQSCLGVMKNLLNKGIKEDKLREIESLEKLIPQDSNLQNLLGEIREYINTKYEDGSTRKLIVQGLFSKINQCKENLKVAITLMTYVAKRYTPDKGIIKNIIELSPELSPEVLKEIMRNGDIKGAMDSLSVSIMANYFGKEISNILRNVGMAFMVMKIKEVMYELKEKPYDTELSKKLGELTSILKNYSITLDYYLPKTLNPTSYDASKIKEEVKKEIPELLN